MAGAEGKNHKKINWKYDYRGWRTDLYDAIKRIGCVKMNKKNEKEKHGNRRKLLIRVCTVIVIVVATSAVLLSRSCQWMLKTWTGLTMEELVYHLNSSLEGTNMDMIWDFVQYCVTVTGIVCILLVCACALLRKRKALQFLFIRHHSAFACDDRSEHFQCVDDTDVSAYANNRSEYSTFIDDNYVDPKNVTLTFPQQKRNLIYIFWNPWRILTATLKAEGRSNKM